MAAHEKYSSAVVIMAYNSFFNTVRTNLNEQSEPAGRKGCLKWVSPVSGNKMPHHGRIRQQFPQDYHNKRHHAHRVAYIVNSNLLAISVELYVSHLCHYLLCVNPQYLNLEPQAVHNEWQSCGDICTGHNMLNRNSLTAFWCTESLLFLLKSI